MSLTADSLQSSAGGTARMEAVARELLAMVDTKIREADRKFGLNIVTVDIASEFNIPGLSKQDQQRFVYSSLIKSLKDRGFAARANLTESGTTLFVRFVIEFNQAEIDAMNKIVGDAMFKSDGEIRAFCQGEDIQGGNASAARS